MISFERIAELVDLLSLTSFADFNYGSAIFTHLLQSPSPLSSLYLLQLQSHYTHTNSTLYCCLHSAGGCFSP